MSPRQSLNVEQGSKNQGKTENLVMSSQEKEIERSDMEREEHEAKEIEDREM